MIEQPQRLFKLKWQTPWGDNLGVGILGTADDAEVPYMADFASVRVRFGYSQPSFVTET